MTTKLPALTVTYRQRTCAEAEPQDVKKKKKGGSLIGVRAANAWGGRASSGENWKFPSCPNACDIPMYNFHLGK